MDLKNHIPSGPIDQKWDKHRADLKLVNPANKRKFSVIVVGTGLAGSSAAATLAELGYNVQALPTMTQHVGHTRSLLRVVSMQRRITRTTVIRSGVCSTTQSKAATSAPVKPMCIVWPKYR